MPFLFCLPFANRASVSDDLYIDFNRNHLIFPAAYLVFQVDALFIIFPSEAHICIAYHVLHIMPCFVSYCLCIAPLLIVGPFLVFLLWVEPGDEYVIKEPVEYANKDQAFDNSENFAGKMTIPSKSLLSLLASCSLFLLCRITYHLLYHASCIAMSSLKPTFVAICCLAMLPLLLSPSYSVASCR